jgi:hypothetical protein
LTDSCFKHLDFECEPQKADDIKQKFGHLMSFVNSPHVAKYESSPKSSSSKWSRKVYKQAKKNIFD